LNTSLETTRKLLADIYRMLSPGGTIRIIVPDAELYLRTYLS
jgi:predicted SAM-dependent methyltransferase